MVSEFNTGFNLVGAQIGKSTFKQNEMFDNLKGLHLALNCSMVTNRITAIIGLVYQELQHITE